MADKKVEEKKPESKKFCKDCLKYSKMTKMCSELKKFVARKTFCDLFARR
jgi:hypothetical protein